MKSAANPASAEDLPLPRRSDEAAVEIHHFFKQIFDLFEARYGDQITRLDSVNQDGRR